MRSVREIQGGKWRVEHLEQQETEEHTSVQSFISRSTGELHLQQSTTTEYKQNVAITTIQPALWLHHRTPDKRTLLKHFLSSAFL